MSTFKVKDFVSKFEDSRSLALLETLSKKKISAVAEHYELPVEGTDQRYVIKQRVIQFCISEGMLEPLKQESEIMIDKRLELEMQYEIKALELEAQERALEAQEGREMKAKELELASQERIKEMELKSAQATIAAQTPSVSLTFDPSKSVRLVPSFQEKDVDKYFLHFKKITLSLEWPREVWTILLQSVLKGKAQEIYAALSTDDGSDYDKVKESILKAYELVPEVYRQRFRNLKKPERQTHVEFTREKENLFDRWCHSQNIGDDFNKLKQLIIIEEFKNY